MDLKEIRWDEVDWIYLSISGFCESGNNLSGSLEVGKPVN